MKRSLAVEWMDSSSTADGVGIYIVDLFDRKVRKYTPYFRISSAFDSVEKRYCEKFARGKISRVRCTRLHTTSLFILSRRNGQTARRRTMQRDCNEIRFDSYHHSRSIPFISFVGIVLFFSDREHRIYVNLILTCYNTINNTKGKKTNLGKKKEILIQFPLIVQTCSLNSPYFTGKCPTRDKRHDGPSA